jgi:hypothetical protein
VPTDPAHLGTALVNGAKLRTPDGDVLIEVREIARLNLSTGSIVACDPFLVSAYDTPFERRVSGGRYPIELSVARFPNGDQRVALASIRIDMAHPVRWEMATRPGQNAAALKDDEILGYGVDAGTGCFMDMRAATALVAAEPAYFEQIIAAMRGSFVPTWGWADVALDSATGLNLVVFSSGFGDGFYASFWGYDEGGTVCRLTTDFRVLPASGE